MSKDSRAGRPDSGPAASSLADEPEGLRIERGYDGKYKGRAELRRLRRELKSHTPEAVKRIERVLRQPVPLNHILLRLKDAGTRTDGLHASTSTERSGGSPTQVITLFPEYWAGKRFDLRRTLCHEMVHAAQRAAMGDRYSEVPRWLREGLALLTAGQGEERINTLLAIHSLGDKQDPGNLVLPLQSGRSLRFYAVYYAAVRDLSERDPEAPAELWHALIRGREHRAAVADLTGMGFDAWTLHVQARLAEDLAVRTRTRHPRWRRLQRADGERDYPAVLRIADEILTADPGAYTAPAVLMRRSHALIHSRREEEALADLETVIDKFSAVSDLGPVAARKRCRLLYRLGRLDKAHVAAHDFLRDYSYAERSVADIRELLKQIHADLRAARDKASEPRSGESGRA